jgi:hypothetical protein
MLFTSTATLVSGFFDGVQSNCLDSFSNIQGVRKNVANIDGVKKYYDGRMADNEKTLRESRDL